MPESISKKQEATVRDFLNVVFRRKYVILAVVGFTTFAVFYLNASQPQTYVSSSRILVQRGQRGDVFTGRPTYLTWAEEVSSQIEVILSEAVFESAKEIFADSVAMGGYPSVLRFNPGSARAEVLGQSNVFVLSYSAFDADECRLGCSAITEAYTEYYRERTAPPAVAEYFVREIEEALVDLERWRVKKSEFLDSEQYVGLSEEARRRSQMQAHLEMGLADVETELAAQKLKVAEYDALRALPADELEANLAIGAERSDLQTAIMMDIKHGLQGLRLNKESLLQKYTDRHPEVIAVTKQIQDLLGDLKQEVHNAYQVQKLRNNGLIAKQRSLAKQLRATEAALSVLPKKAVELSRIENNIESAQTRYDVLLRRQHEAEIAVASNPEWEITILTAAGRAWPSKTKDYVRLALGPFLALVVGLGIAFFFESLDHSLKNVGEVEEYLRAPVLATFTEVARKSKV
ncbi:MAG: hypothetical protein V3V49_08645 [Candidatus Krumholzibacteria bacterium]